MPRQTDAREKMIRSAALLFRERGVSATSFSDVIEHSGAPRGSIYHHFGEGKTQLAEEATEWAGEMILSGLTAALARAELGEVIERTCRQWSDVLERSSFNAGCTVLAASLEGDREPSVRDAAGRVFGRWQERLAQALVERGVEEARARSIGALIVAAIEGAIVLSRAQRSVEPLERACTELREVVRLALEPSA